MIGIAVLCLVILVADVAWSQQEPIDFDRARGLRQRSQRGEQLTQEEHKYLQRAIEMRQGNRPNRDRGAIVSPPLNLTPLTDLGGDDHYKDQAGGLYGSGSNQPPQSHLDSSLKQARLIRPRDRDGNPAPNGKVVVISVGMSNTTQEFSAFVQLAKSDPDKSPRLVIIDGAQGGMDAKDWSHPEGRSRNERPDPWKTLERRLQQANVSPQQVQVAWIKQARRSPASIGEFPEHAQELRGHLATILNRLSETYPNLRIAFLSSRIYAGYAKSNLNPEPYAYESAFAVRWLIEDQIANKPALNYDPAQGQVRSPLLLWGPYLWANGLEGRKVDELTWEPVNFAADGTHPSDSGRHKVAKLLLHFMKTQPTTRPWFVKD